MNPKGKIPVEVLRDLCDECMKSASMVFGFNPTYRISDLGHLEETIENNFEAGGDRTTPASAISFGIYLGEVLVETFQRPLGLRRVFHLMTFGMPRLPLILVETKKSVSNRYFECASFGMIGRMV